MKKKEWWINVNNKSKVSWESNWDDEVFIVPKNFKYPNGEWEFYQMTQDLNPPYFDRMLSKVLKNKAQALKFAKAFMKQGGGKIVK